LKVARIVPTFDKMSKIVRKPSTKANEASSSIAKSISEKSKQLKKGKESVVRNVEEDKKEYESVTFRNASCEDRFNLHKTKKLVVEKTLILALMHTFISLKLFLH